MKNKSTIKFINITLIVLILLQIIMPVCSSANESKEADYYYISDIKYITENNWSYAGWGQIMKDQNTEGGTISLLIDGYKIYYNKGIGAHATSQLTYDISSYSNKYTRFVAKLGIDSSKNGGGNVWFKISASNDGNNWTQLYKSDSITSSQNALEVDLDIKDYKYLRLYADKNGNNGRDHVVYADARIVKENYDLSTELNNVIKPVAYYDEIINKNTPEENYQNNLELVLKREFVNRMGYWPMQNMLKNDTNGQINEILNWILNDKQNLQLFIETGNIGNSEKCLNILSNLYTNYKDVIGNEGDKLVYKKMLIALAISYSTDLPATPLAFNSPMANYDAVKRYELMKKFYDNNLFARKEEFKNYTMELMRFVMNDSIANEELEWLRGYSESKYPNDLNRRLNPYEYMQYIHPNYNQERLYDQNNYEMFNKKYLLDKYNISYGLNSDGSKTPKTWMVMEAGGICWNISRLGQNLHKTYGIPTVGIYQPAHEAYLTYSLDSNNKGIWGIGNNIFGWGKSATTWYGGNGTRLLFNWNNKEFANKHITDSKTGNNVGYQLLGQAALNEYDKYLESYFYYLIANSYSDLKVKEEIYNKSLSKLNINLDDYDKLIAVYKEQGNKSSLEWRALAEKIIDIYTYYPMAMVDLLKLIEPNLDKNDTLEIDILKTDALKKATKATNAESLQSGACREIANALLGENKVDLASFSFDGKNAGKIIMNSKYDDYDFQVQYSLDGEQTWTATLEHSISLTAEQIESINAEKDIKVKISGSNQVFTIDITTGENISDKSLIMNDDEDIFIGKTEYLEYSLDDGITWKDYTKIERFTENQKVKARYKAHGTTLSGEIREYNFTKNTDETLKYINVENINFVSAGNSQNGQEPQHMIDGSTFTSWHTKYGEIAQDKSYIIRFNKAKHLSQISYDPEGVNGRIKSAKIYVSLDGIEWNLVSEVTGLANDETRKTITLDKSVPARYVKIEATETYGNHEGPNKYVSGKRFNYYEDTTKEFKEPEIEYSINSLTNQDVVATIKLPYGYKAVGTTSYTFKNNGKYEFTYKDINDEEKVLNANVTWIDKEVPTARVEYDITTKTQFAVKATLKDISKENVTIIDGSNGTYTFSENGKYVFKIKDQAGNVGEIVAKVTWIEQLKEVKGDINGDGILDIIDLSILNKHLIEKKTINDAQGLNAADINKDGVIDIVDLSILNKEINK